MPLASTHAVPLGAQLSRRCDRPKCFDGHLDEHVAIGVAPFGQAAKAVLAGVQRRRCPGGKLGDVGVAEPVEGALGPTASAGVVDNSCPPRAARSWASVMPRSGSTGSAAVRARPCRDACGSSRRDVPSAGVHQGGSAPPGGRSGSIRVQPCVTRYGHDGSHSVRLT
jgi:hypothetical protein